MKRGRGIRHPRRGNHDRGLRRAGTTAGVVTGLGVAGALTTVAVVVQPAWLTASPDPELDVIEAVHPRHRDIATTLGHLVGRSHEVLGVHQRGATPYLEIVLWVEDRENLGTPDLDEIAVIAHSEVMRTIGYYAVVPPEDTDLAPPPPPAPLPSDISSSEFCRTWRERSDVEPRVLATGVERFSIAPSDHSDAGSTRYRISLTWAADSTDGPDRASLVLDANVRDE